jgi:hypothetical protein
MIPTCIRTNGKEGHGGWAAAQWLRRGCCCGLNDLRGDKSDRFILYGKTGQRWTHLRRCGQFERRSERLAVEAEELDSSDKKYQQNNSKKGPPSHGGFPLLA